MSEIKDQPFAEPKGWHLKIVNHPPYFMPPLWSDNKIGDAASDARAEAIATRTACWQTYTMDNNQLGTDIGQYNTDNAEYDRQCTTSPPELVNPNKTTVFNALGAAYTALASESANINACYNWVASGDVDLTAGDNSQNMQQKVMLYNSAKGKYTTATAALPIAEGAHTAFITQISIAEAILF